MVLHSLSFNGYEYFGHNFIRNIVVAIRISECSITSAAAPINGGLNLKA
jgi:hypothetical protein